MAGKLRGYLPHRWPQGFAPTFIPFADVPHGAFGQSYAVTEAGDVIIVPTPGHTSGHVSVIVKADSLSFFLAGDTSYSQSLLLSRTRDGVSPDVDRATRTIGTIWDYARTEPTVYLPSHDAESAFRLAQRETLAVPD